MTKLEFEKSEKALVLIVALNPETGKAMYDYYDWDGTDFWLNSTRNDFPECFVFMNKNKSAIEETIRSFGIES